MDSVYNKLKSEIIHAGLCTHCGTCVGLSNEQLEMQGTENGPMPVPINTKLRLDKLVYDACPGKGFNYPDLVQNIFSSKVDDWRIGFYKDIFVGYSLNDTIVVYDRIRENIRMVRKKNFLDILNISINETLSRTIITSLTTLFVLLSLLLAGGIAVKFFAIAMIVGVLIGTYSSIFIASTSLYFLGANPES